MGSICRRARAVWRLAFVVAVVATAMCFAVAKVEAQWSRAQGELRAFDLAKAMIVRADLPVGRALTVQGRPQGGVTDFLMTADSLAALEHLPVLAAVHEFREKVYDTPDPSGLAVEIRVLMVPPGFLLEHGFADPEVAADQALQSGCVLTDERLAAALGWREGQEVALGPDRLVRDGLARIRERVGADVVIDDGRLAVPVCVRPLHLPLGVGLFEHTVFLAQDHPALAGRTSFPKPLLWLSLAQAVDLHAASDTVRQFIAERAVPAQPELSLSVVSLAEYGQGGQGMRALQAWRERLRWAVWAVGLGLVLSLLVVRWGPLRRELALRRALGQTLVQAPVGVLLPLTTGVLLGLVVAMPLSLILLWWDHAFTLSVWLGVVPRVWFTTAFALMLLLLAVGLLARSPPMPVLLRADV